MSPSPVTRGPLWFFVNLGINGTMADLTRCWATYRATRQLVEAKADPSSPTVAAARDIDNLLTVCREVRATWPADLVDEWARLVRGGMWPAAARDAVRYIHTTPGEDKYPLPAGNRQGAGVGTRRIRRWFGR